MELLLLVWFFFALIGVLIGKNKGQTVEGFIAGLLLGPIGILWLVSQKPKEKCPECGGVLEGKFKKCKHCGSEINPSSE